MNENVRIMWAQILVISKFSLIKHAHICKFLLLSIYFSDKKEICAWLDIIFVNLETWLNQVYGRNYIVNAIRIMLSILMEICTTIIC